MSPQKMYSKTGKLTEDGMKQNGDSVVYYT